MSLESSNFETEIDPQEAAVLYESLPEKMKTGYYGLGPEGKTFLKKEDAGAEAVPYVIVTFADGRRISLHLILKSDLSFEDQAQNIKQASLEDQDITDIQLVWQSASI